MSDCCIMIWTPTNIKECVEDDDGNAIDCFAQAVPQSEYTALQVQALWRRYRYAVCDSMNVSRWLQQVKDRAEEINRRYLQMFAAYDAQDLTDMKMGYTDTYDLTDTAQSSGSDTFTTETEDLPQSADPTGQWLSGRTKSTTTPGTVDTSKRAGTMRHDVQDVLLAEEYARLQDMLRDPLEKYVGEFSDLFANRW